MKYLLKLRYFALISLFLCSCTPQKRMQRLLRKHPNLISVVDRDTIIRDTIIENDTFISKEYKDSFRYILDTVYETDRYRLEINIDSLKLTIKPDTFFQVDSIPYKKLVKVKGKVVTVYEKRSFIWYLLPLSVGFFLAWLFKSK